MTISDLSLEALRGVDVSQLHYLELGTLSLEVSGVLPGASLAYETWGTLNADASNAVLVQHALTGSSHAAQGESAQPGWWQELVGPGKAVDTEKYFVVAANILGGCYGSTGPSSIAPDGEPWGSRFPFLTLRDSVQAEARLADALGITRWHAVIGGSMGGARALEWAVSFPERVLHAIVLAACAASTAEQIALAQTQILAIQQDPRYQGGDYYQDDPPLNGLGLARRIAHISYRSESELAARFGRQAQQGELPVSAQRAGQLRLQRYQVESYLDHKAAKLSQIFDPNSYLTLTEALMSHDLGRGRGGLRAALERTSGVRFSLAAVSSDRLYLPSQMAELAAALPKPVQVHQITSEIGHDGFLTETAQIAALIAQSGF
ncbi:homoserine O-acetyltransferase MetX [Psychromicrobium lacuslunae]|uniref:Homoserine O-acetyltransferase n=1 Tax=Psychromicrobium lacuslunae TaxID=1618207 RepID=A0A0D4BZB9_9MICC|nr:homoserine O-acetyltransferase [Psychromicrobium lacuslunae]AJT41466.1 homoserine acetyltransferase [Psychromicrobium lacuslunae]